MGWRAGRQLLDLNVSINNSWSSQRRSFSWFLPVVVICLLLGVGGVAALLYWYCAPRRALRKGKVPAELCFAIGTLPDHERDLYLTAQCPLSQEEWKQEGRRECPVCLGSVDSRMRWAVFPCRHGLCTKCLWAMVRAREQKSACPLCRIPLFVGPEMEQQREEEAQTSMSMASISVAGSQGRLARGSATTDGSVSSGEQGEAGSAEGSMAGAQRLAENGSVPAGAGGAGQPDAEAVLAAAANVGAAGSEVQAAAAEPLGAAAAVAAAAGAADGTGQAAEALGA